LVPKNRLTSHLELILKNNNSKKERE